MLMSMTGFGKREIQNNDILISIEIKSINSRYLEINHKVPRMFSEDEDSLLNLVRRRLVRGKIMITINYIVLNEKLSKPIIDIAKVNEYINIANSLSQNKKIDGKISINKLLSFPDVFINTQVSGNIPYKRLLSKCGNEAINDLIRMRTKEGKNLSGDIIDRLKNIKRSLIQIGKISNTNQKEVLKHYKKKVSSYFNKNSKIVLDDNRLLQEIIIFLEKKDINEEIIRLNSHIKIFEECISNGKFEKGKRMTFLLQEFLREINTIGSKTDSVKISHLAVNIKSEIEKIREQVQNIL